MGHPPHHYDYHNHTQSYHISIHISIHISTIIRYTATMHHHTIYQLQSKTCLYHVDTIIIPLVTEKRLGLAPSGRRACATAAGASARGTQGERRFPVDMIPLWIVRIVWMG